MLFAAADGSGGIPIFGDWFNPATIFLLPSGAFLTLGFLIACVQKIRNTAEERALTKAIEMDAIEGGYHATLMKDPVSGKVIRRSSYREPVPAEDTAEEVLEDPELPAEKAENDEKGAE